MRKVKIKVEGHVQGVGFRFLTMMLARELGVKGFVQNKMDGSVYIEAMADEDVIKKFISEISASLGPASHVDKVKVEEDDSIKERTKFSIL